MADSIDLATKPKLHAVSHPGGVARQYRVQVWDDAAGGWRLWAAFRQWEHAENCCQQLEENGRSSRIVSYNISPAGL